MARNYWLLIVHLTRSIIGWFFGFRWIWDFGFREAWSIWIWDFGFREAWSSDYFTSIVRILLFKEINLIRSKQFPKSENKVFRLISQQFSWLISIKWRFPESAHYTLFTTLSSLANPPLPLTTSNVCLPAQAGLGIPPLQADIRFRADISQDRQSTRQIINYTLYIIH